MGKHSVKDRPAFLKTLSPNSAEEERRSALLAYLFETLPDLSCNSYHDMPNGRVDIL
jgi:hypothetical protein